MKLSQKQQITSKGKAADQIEDSPAASCGECARYCGSKAEHTRKYSSILNRFVTQPSGVRCVFEMASNIIPAQSKSN
jgi:hypothetical protein